MHSHNRASVVHQIRYALGHPGRIPRHLRRLTRDAWLRLGNRGHVAYYRAVMRSDTARNPRGAVGSRSYRRWTALGKMQFDYLVRHGLRPEHRMLEIGCGNLRAGRLFIGYLDPGNYYGIDISPDILIAAQETLVTYGLRDRFPHLLPVGDLRFTALPDQAFDVVHAHSVFSHSPLPVIEECLWSVGRIVRPGGWFDFTFDRTEGREHHVLREDFYYRAETLLDLAADCGLRATLMDDWERLPHRQSKIRITFPGPGTPGEQAVRELDRRGEVVRDPARPGAARDPALS
ncbi:class I SAM-dependent methyltransferase [Streptosporangium oxazolinicum]|uniref:Class I SAM-dependent methyltransferase n=1 Tax=Streptosporangium oxazolinicum TaxID=909287 RepID=A0ABP8AVV8_9ACTN